MVGYILSTNLHSSSKDCFDFPLSQLNFLGCRRNKKGVVLCVWCEYYTNNRVHIVQLSNTNFCNDAESLDVVDLPDAESLDVVDHCGMSQWHLRDRRQFR